MWKKNNVRLRSLQSGYRCEDVVVLTCALCRGWIGSALTGNPLLCNGGSKMCHSESCVLFCNPSGTRDSGLLFSFGNGNLTHQTLPQTPSAVRVRGSKNNQDKHQSPSSQQLVRELMDCSNTNTTFKKNTFVLLYLYTPPCSSVRWCREPVEGSLRQE